MLFFLPCKDHEAEVNEKGAITAKKGIHNNTLCHRDMKFPIIFVIYVKVFVT